MNHQWITIDNVNFTPKPYNDIVMREMLRPGVMIKFQYGIKELSYMTGVIRQVYPTGVDCFVSIGGYYSSSWDRIIRVWLPKERMLFKPTRLNVEKHAEITAYLDGVLDAIKAKLYPAEMTDDRVDCTTKFYRHLKIHGKGHKHITLSIKDENAESLTVDDCGDVRHINVSDSYRKGIDNVLHAIENMLGKNVEVMEVGQKKRGRPANPNAVKKEYVPTGGKRGRPKKVVVEGAEVKPEVPAGGKRSRGRPKSDKTIAKPAYVPTGKSRGRPKKAVVEGAPVVEKPVVAEIKRRRGRPCKS